VNQRYFKVNAFQIGNVPQLGSFGRAKGSGIEAMFAGITVAFLATALPLNLCLVCSHVLRNLTREIQFVRVAHEFQAEINMNSLFEQGENVTSSTNGDDKRNPNAKGQSSNKVQMSKFKGHTAGLETRDWRHLEISRDTVEINWRYVRDY